MKLFDLLGSEDIAVIQKLKRQAYASTLKSRALSVLIYLIDRSNKELTCFPAIPTMAEQLHISVSTVKRALHELLDSGYIKKDARFREKNKGQTSNLYTLVLFGSDDDPDFKDHTEESRLEEGKQEKADGTLQRKSQVEHIGFDTLKRQMGGAEKLQKTEENSTADTVCAEEYPETRQNNKSGSCPLIRVIRSAFVVRSEGRNFVIIQQYKEKIIRIVFFCKYYKILLYLWTGEGGQFDAPLNYSD